MELRACCSVRPTGEGIEQQGDPRWGVDSGLVGNERPDIGMLETAFDGVPLRRDFVGSVHDATGVVMMREQQGFK